MHMTPVTYSDYTFFGDINFEVSKRSLIEKIIYLSVGFFTIATEVRFHEELEK